MSSAIIIKIDENPANWEGFRSNLQRNLNTVLKTKQQLDEQLQISMKTFQTAAVSNTISYLPSNEPSRDNCNLESSQENNSYVDLP